MREMVVLIVAGALETLHKSLEKNSRNENQRKNRGQSDHCILKIG